jgi:hypothetical protein
MPAGPHRRRGEGVEWGRERPRSAAVRPPAGGVPHAHLSGVSCPAVCGPDVCSDRDRMRDQLPAEILARRAPVNIVMIIRARSVVP